MPHSRPQRAHLSQRCARCGSRSHYHDSCNNKARCPACPHAADFAGCPAWRAEKEAIKLHVTQNISISEARQAVSKASAPKPAVPKLPRQAPPPLAPENFLSIARKRNRPDPDSPSSTAPVPKKPSHQSTTHLSLPPQVGHAQAALRALGMRGCAC